MVVEFEVEGGRVNVWRLVFGIDSKKRETERSGGEQEAEQAEPSRWSVLDGIADRAERCQLKTK